MRTVDFLRTQLVSDTIRFIFKVWS